MAKYGLIKTVYHTTKAAFDDRKKRLNDGRIIVAEPDVSFQLIKNGLAQKANSTIPKKIAKFYAYAVRQIALYLMRISRFLPRSQPSLLRTIPENHA